MSMSTELVVILAYGVGLFLVYLFGRLLLTPVKWAGKLLLNSIIGGLIIVFVNFFGENAGFSIPLNPLNAIIVGILGIPGAALLWVLSM